MDPRPTRRLVSALVVPLGLWWLLTGGAAASWLVGAPAVAAAVAASLAMSPHATWRLSVPGLLAFVPYFAWRSLAGSVDVAIRAFRPSLPITPSIEPYSLSLPPTGPARVFFASIVNLLPGTASVDLRDDEVLLHVLHDPASTTAELHRLEARVAALFAVPLASRPSGGGTS
jgi:multicomponent Na+:H+ antiporter subunit E